MLCCLAHDSRVTVSALFLSEETYQNQGLWLLFYYFEKRENDFTILGKTSLRFYYFG